MREQSQIEKERLRLQNELDALKTQEERNRLGQFATPGKLALDILAHASELLGPNVPIRFLDPAFGTGAFYSALRELAGPTRIIASHGYEIDPHYALPTKELWAESRAKIHMCDFTRAEPPDTDREKFNLVVCNPPYVIVCNPPYVRHHHISALDKCWLQDAVRVRCGIQTNGLSGLYCYFLCLSHAWLARGGIGIWLIPSEFMDVNYGRAMKKYLLDRVTLLRIHRFDPSSVQFEDALVSSAIVSFRNEEPDTHHEVQFTYGGSLLEPEVSVDVKTGILAAERKWTRFPLESAPEPMDGPTITDFFTIKRGLATGANKFFILSLDEIRKRNIPLDYFRPILPSPRFLDQDELEEDDAGNPLIDKKLFLLDCRIDERRLGAECPSLYEYLQTGKPKISDRYLCRRRKPWYAQEIRAPSPFLCTYMGRAGTRSGRPFRFILNHSKATATNVYLLLYPKPLLRRTIAEDSRVARKILGILNSLKPKTLLQEGRFYGGGLHKLEPRELGRVPVPELTSLVPEVSSSMCKQMHLFPDHVQSY